MSAKDLSVIHFSTAASLEMVDITARVADAVRSSGVDRGLCHVFAAHTTAGITINENADPAVRSDILKAIGKMVPSDIKYRHSEGNSPAHVMASLVGPSETIIVETGRLVLGTWQGIYFCEFDGPRSRKVYVRVLGG